MHNCGFVRILACVSLLVLFTLFAIPRGASTPSRGVEYLNKFTERTEVFTPLDSEIFVKFAGSTKAESRALVAASMGLEFKVGPSNRHQFGLLSVPSGQSAESLCELLAARPEVIAATPGYADESGNRLYIDPQVFNAEFYGNPSAEEVDNQIRDWGSRVIEQHPTRGLFTLAVPAGMTAFEAVAVCNEWPNVKLAEPDFYGVNDCQSDVYLSDIWHLNNTGQESGYTAGNDVRAFYAWDITTGSPNVVIVIIDSGIDIDRPEPPDYELTGHPDLIANIIEREEGEDWNFESVDSLPIPNDYHGTGCAGIAAAAMNDSGVRGIAPSCRIMPLKAGDDLFRGVWRANAINHAVDRAGDFDGMVISCSWGSCRAYTEDAIKRAADTCAIPIFAAAGNGGGEGLKDLASKSQTIAVGAMAPCDDARKDSTTCDGEEWASQFGNALDVAAPGVLIYTTDIRGDDPGGLNPSSKYPDDLANTSYTKYFNGTSAATPLAAGIGALLLSADTTLTDDDIRSILRLTADKVGGYNYNWNANKAGHSKQLGFGRVNAFRALLKVKYDAEVVSTEIGESTSWPTAPQTFSNVFITGDVSVASSCTLTISPGTTVYCAADSGIDIKVGGRLIAEASGDTLITFKSSSASPAEDDWNGIQTFADSGAVTLQNCVIEHATFGVKLRGGGGAASTIRSCTFRNNETAHLDIFDDVDVDVDDCTFEVDSPHGIQIGNGSNPSNTVVDSCTIIGTGNATHGIYVSCGGPTLSNNVISGFSTGRGISTYLSSSPTTTGNSISDCKYGVRCEGSSGPSVGDASSVTSILDCTAGIYTEDTASPDVSGLEIDSCTVGIETRDSSDPDINEDNTISFCITGLYAKDTSEPYVRKTVFDSCTTNSVEVTFSAEPDLGTISDFGNNSFNKGGNCPTYRHVKATKTRPIGVGDVMAEKNWWGASSPPSDCFVGMVDYDPWLSSDPNSAKPEQGVTKEMLTYRPALWQNSPNPSTGTTLISYQVPNPGAEVTLRVYDAMGRLVKTLVDERREPGPHEVLWTGFNKNGKVVPSGVYFYEIEIGDDFKAAKKMSLVR